MAHHEPMTHFTIAPIWHTRVVNVVSVAFNSDGWESIMPVFRGSSVCHRDFSSDNGGRFNAVTGLFRGFCTLARFFGVRAVSRLATSTKTTVILGGTVVLYRDVDFESLHICTNETVALFTGWSDGLSYDAST